jgi:ABC-type sugar transport system ATPase subunit
MANLRIEHLNKRYGATMVLNDVNLNIEDGEFVVLVGPSGCGKSTLLRMIAGLDGASGGDIHIAGKLVNTLAPAERGIAMVFQSYALYPHMNVRKNMTFGLKFTGVPPNERERRVAEAARMLRLEELLERYPRDLSGGQRQRVAIGRAIVREPAVFLFDEPLSNLDAALRVSTRVEIANLHRMLKSTIVYVTHDQVEAMTLADRIVVMNRGCIEQVGRPLDLYYAPANLFVAGFIGTPQMNLLPAVFIALEHRDGAQEGSGTSRGRFRVGNDTIVLAVDPAIERLPRESKVTLGIRPRSLELVPEPQADALIAQVDLIEPMGAETLLHLVDGGLEFRTVVDRRTVVRVGERVNLRFRPGQSHVFDSSERRVAS